MTSFPDRKAGLTVAPFILNRWSPRAFTLDKITQKELLTILDAGRWAPSAYDASHGVSFMHDAIRRVENGFSRG